MSHRNPSENSEESFACKVILNVGGQKHETTLSTLDNFKDTRVTWISERLRQMKKGKREFFIDRHPGMFSHILNYFRTGKLHAPRDICGPMFAEELSFWGIDPKLIEPCCWSYFDEHNELEEKLQGFKPLDGKDSVDESESEPEQGLEDEEEENVSGEGSKTLNNGQQAMRELRKTACPELSRDAWNQFCKHVWRLLENPFSSKPAWVVSFISLILTFLVVVLFCITTMPSIDLKGEDKVLYSLESASISWFTLEFLVRLITTPKKKKFLRTVQTWVDVLAIIPFYLGLAFPNEKDLRVLKILYVLRLYRAFRAFRFSYVLQVFIQTIKGSFRELFLLFFTFAFLVVTYGSLAYYAERNENTKFSSIPASFWWSLITMTTVGYGDITPETVYGKLVGAACALSGVLMMALPVSVVASNFSLYNNYAKVKFKLPPRPKKKVFNGNLQLTQNDSPETFTTGGEGSMKTGNGRRRSYRTRSRYSSVIPRLEEEDCSDNEELELTQRQEKKEQTPEKNCTTPNGSPKRTKEVCIPIPEMTTV